MISEKNITKFLFAISSFFLIATSIYAQQSPLTDYVFNDFHQYNNVSRVSIFKMDKSGVLYASGVNGLYRFTGRKRELIPLVVDGKRWPVIAMTVSKRGRVIVSTSNNQLFLLEAGSLRELTSKNAVNDSLRVYSFLEVERDSFLLGTTQGVATYKLGGEIKQLKKGSLFQSLANDIVADLIQLKGSVYLYTTSGLFKTDGKTIFRKISFPEPIQLGYNRFSVTGKDSTLWVSGQSIYRVQNDSLVKVVHNNTSGNFTQVYAVREGVFVSTLGGVIHYFDKKKLIGTSDASFESFRINASFLDPLNRYWLCYSANSTIRKYTHIPIDISLVDSLKSLYIDTGLDSSGNILYLKKNTFAIVAYNFHKKEKKTLFKNSNRLSLRVVNGFSKNRYLAISFEDKDNAYWVVNNALQRIPTTVAGIRVIDANESSKGTIYFSTERHGTCVLTSDGYIQPLYNQQFKAADCFTIDKFGCIFTGTVRGITYDAKGKLRPLHKQYPILDQAITSLESYGQYVYVGTRFDGLYVLKSIQADSVVIVAHYGSDNGIPEGEINKIVGNDNGEVVLWVGLNNLVAMDNVQNEKNARIRILNKETSEIGNFADPEVLEMHGNSILFIGGGKQYLFQVKDIFNAPNEQPNVVITDLRLFNKKVNWRGKGYVYGNNDLPEDVQLSADENFITIDFEGIDLDEEVILYQYKLVGSDADWFPITTANYAAYNNLISGEYTFLVRASSDGKAWSMPVQYSFKILPPWYKTWWAFIIWCFLILLLLALLFAFFIQRERARSANLLKQQREELLTIIAHDLKSPMNSYQSIAETIDYLIQTEQYGKLERIVKQMEISSLSLATMLDNLIQWGISFKSKPALNFDNVQIVPMVDALRNIYQVPLTQKGIVLNYVGKVEIFTDAHVLHLILRNLLDNSIKNSTPGSTILLRVQDVNNVDQIEFSNSTDRNSISKLKIVEKLIQSEKNWEPGKNGLGVGLVLVLRFLKQLNGTLTIYFNDPIITFIIRIPKRCL